MTLIFFSLLRLALWPHMLSILENVPSALENNVSSAVLGWNVLNISVKSICSSGSFKATVSLLIFCLDDQSTDVSGVLRFLTLIVLLLITSCMFVNSCFMYLGAPILSA